MISTLRRVSLRHFAGHKLRTLSTILGVALGVAAVVGVRLLSDSASRSFRKTIDRLAGRAVLQISNGDVGVPEELVDEVKAVPGVRVVAPSIQSFLGVVGLEGERIYVFGIDLLADQELRDYQSGSSETTVEDPLVFLAQPDSVALTTGFLKRNRLAEGDRIRVKTAAGPEDLVIRATLDIRTGPATLFDGRLAVMDVFAAQRLLRLDRRFTQIDVGIDEGARIADVEAEIDRRIRGRGIVERPFARGETLEKLLAGTELAFAVAGMLAVVVALYLVFNTMTIAVAQRRREIGILRATGMRRGEVLRLVLAESLILGAVGSAVGLWLGFWLARALSASFTANVSSRFVPIEPAEIYLEPMRVLRAMGLGLVVAVVAAILPAREAVRVQPLEALRAYASRDGGEGLRRLAVVGALLMAAGLVIFSLRKAIPLDAAISSNLSQNGFLVGLSLAAPAVMRSLARRTEVLYGRFFGPLGIIASRSLVAQVRRLAITAAALLVALANAIATASIVSTLERTLTLWMDADFGKLEIGISSGTGLTATDATPLPGSLAEDIGRLPEIAAVDAERWVKIPCEGLLTNLVARDAAVYQQRMRRFILINGEETPALEALARGEAAIVSDVFAHRFRKRLGDTIVLPSPSGPVELRIAGIHLDMNDLGTVVVDRSLYRRRWHDDTITFIDPVLRDGADREQTMEKIRRQFGDRYGLFLTTFDQLRRESHDLLNQSVAAAYPLIAIAITIALLGVVNSLFASVLDRRREIGLLRAIGATRGQIVKSVILECALIGLASGAFGVLTGSILGYMTAGTVLPDVFGITGFYRYPAAASVFALLAAVVLAVAAGTIPGRAAARLKVTEALAYE